MPPVPKPHRTRTKHFFKEWREYRDLTQDQAIGRTGWSQSKLSRLEAGKTPYSQDDLEIAAEAYNCEAWQLISMNPLREGKVVDMLGLLRQTPEASQEAVIAFLERLKTGTGE